MNYLFNDRNLVRGAVLSVLHLAPSSVIYRTDNDPKVGSGIVALTGPYTGQRDTEIEIEILDGDSDSSQVSTPTFSGVGNGAMTDVSVDGVDAQTYTVSMTELGTTTAAAQAPFQGATLQARTDGLDGNNLRIFVDATGIVRTPTDRALQDDLSAGTNAYVGPQWDFGAKPLDADGNIPADAPRISFGDDPQVYRAYKVYDFTSQQTTFSFSPAPVRDVAAGEIVKAVTGTWGVSVYHDLTIETFSGTSLYDVLSQINASSTLAKVSSPISVNNAPGGMGVTDVSEWTQPLVLSIVEDGSSFVHAANINFTVGLTSPTEQLSIVCVDAGAGTWQVTGDISTDLPNATTGVAYASGPYTFTIPLQTPTQGQDDGNILPTFDPIPRDPTETQVPTMCVEQAVLGAAATTKDYRFIYKRRPPPGCECDDGDLVGGPSLSCLGAVSIEGGASVTQDSLLLRMQKVATAVQTFVASNTAPPANIAALDVAVIEGSAKLLVDGLTTAAAGLKFDYPAWQASTAYTQDQQIEPAPGNGYRYVASAVTAPGNSGSSQPTFPTTIGSTAVDGDVTWKCAGKTALALWDDYEASWESEMTALSGYGTATNVKRWLANASVLSGVFSVNAPGLSGIYVVPTNSHGTGWVYGFGGSNTSSNPFTGSSEPTWPTTLGSSVLDGQAYWIARIQYWFASHSYALNTVLNTYHGLLYKCTTAGTSGTSEPTWGAATVTDGTAVWSLTTAQDLPAGTDTDAALEKYRVQMQEVNAAAGVSPNFDSASANGDGCWQDQGQPYWFESQDGLLPIQVGYGYHSAKYVVDENGKQVVQSTREFYVGLKFGCPDKLKEGDAISISIDGASGGGTYQQGDSFTVRVAHLDPIAFTGGQVGNNTIAFGVRGTQDGILPTYYIPLITPAARANVHAYAVGDQYVPAVANGHFYRIITGGTSAASPPTFATDRSSFADGSAEVQDMGLLQGYDEAGVAFTITQGGQQFALDDAFTFNAIGGHFQWRQDGGSWNGPILIGTTALADGLSATFTGGTTDPSWSPPDAYSFLAIATNGPYQAATPSDGRLVWTGSTTITITPAAPGPASRFAAFDHHIPSDATITLQGSDDIAFGTVPTNISIPWTARDLLAVFAPVTRAYWRLTVDKGGDLFWMFLGEQMQPTTPNAKNDVGICKKRRRTPGIGIRSGVGIDIQHEWTSQESYEDFMVGLDYACANDDGAFAVVINESLHDLSLVRFPPGTEVDTTELRNYQVANPDGVAAPARRQAFSLAVNALP